MRPKCGQEKIVIITESVLYNVNFLLQLDCNIVSIIKAVLVPSFISWISFFKRKLCIKEFQVFKIKLFFFVVFKEQEKELLSFNMLFCYNFFYSFVALLQTCNIATCSFTYFLDKGIPGPQPVPWVSNKSYWAIWKRALTSSK